MTHTIERLGPEDITRVHELWERAGLHFRPDGRDSVTHLSSELAAGTATLLGAWAGGAIVGIVLVTHDGRKGWVNRLAVDPQHRRRGLGRALIAAAEGVLAEAGIDLAAALVEAGNEWSRALFDAADYATHDIVYFRKPLTDLER